MEDTLYRHSERLVNMNNRLKDISTLDNMFKISGNDEEQLQHIEIKDSFNTKNSFSFKFSMNICINMLNRFVGGRDNDRNGK